MHNCNGEQPVGSAKGLGLVDPRLFEEDGDREGKGLTLMDTGPGFGKGGREGLSERIWGGGEYRCKSEGRTLWVIKRSRESFARWANPWPWV